jgi:hypothetical protein
MKNDYERLNRDASELRTAIVAGNTLELECLGSFGTTPALPTPFPVPKLPANLAAASRLALDRLKIVLQRQPIWCFPPDYPKPKSGVLRFEADGRVIQTSLTGERIGEGKITWPHDFLGDDRVQVVVSGSRGTQGGLLAHFSLGESGRIGEDYVDRTGVVRHEMIPGGGCLKLYRRR